MQEDCEAGNRSASVSHQTLLPTIRMCLAKPVGISGLVVLRISLGLAVAWFAGKFLGSPALSHDFVDPLLHLKYYGFEWVRSWPGSGMHYHFLVLTAAALCVALGLFYRIASAVMFLGFSWVFLIDQALYNNHYYLISLLSLLICLMPLHRAFSLDVLRRSVVKSSTIPSWTIWLLRFQIGVVYFFGGIAKLNSDWLSGQPMRLWLAAQTHYPVIGHLFLEEWMVQVFVWGGLLVDLLAVPLMLTRRTRPWMFGLLVLFHVLNSTLFTIGVFPWLMIALTTVFFEPDWPRRLILLTPRNRHSHEPTSGQSISSGWLAAMAVYVAWQLVMPLRHVIYVANPSWTECGHQFAWRMMLREKQAGIRFEATDVATGRSGVVDVRPYLTRRQASKIARNPELARQFAHWLAELFEREGLGTTEIRATCLVSLNGRRPQLLFDPDVNLAAEPRRLGPIPWTCPLTEALRHDAWDVPVSQWQSMPGISSGHESPSAVMVRASRTESEPR